MTPICTEPTLGDPAVDAPSRPLGKRWITDWRPKDEQF